MKREDVAGIEGIEDLAAKDGQGAARRIVSGKSPRQRAITAAAVVAAMLAAQAAYAGYAEAQNPDPPGNPPGTTPPPPDNGGGNGGGGNKGDNNGGNKHHNRHSDNRGDDGFTLISQSSSDFGDLDFDLDLDDFSFIFGPFSLVEIGDSSEDDCFPSFDEDGPVTPDEDCD